MYFSPFVLDWSKHILYCLFIADNFFHYEIKSVFDYVLLLPIFSSSRTLIFPMYLFCAPLLNGKICSILCPNITFENSLTLAIPSEESHYLFYLDCFYKDFIKIFFCILFNVKLGILSEQFNAT